MALRITDDLVARVAAELSSGGWRFSLRQLYYAVCAEAEVPASNAGANGEIALGVLLVLAALILLPFRPVFAVLAALGGVLIVLGVVHRLTVRPVRGRVLAMSYGDFERLFGATPLPGLVDPAAPHPRSGRTVVVCDTAETAAVLAANAGMAGLHELAPVSADAVPAPIPWQRVAVLHDASPRGCALVAELRDAGTLDVVDCGLRPSQVDDDAAQVIEGAPARLPRDLRGVLDAEEISWLASGRRLELATLTPAQLMERVREALPP